MCIPGWSVERGSAVPAVPNSSDDSSSSWSDEPGLGRLDDSDSKLSNDDQVFLDALRLYHNRHRRPKKKAYLKETRTCILRYLDFLFVFIFSINTKKHLIYL